GGATLSYQMPAYTSLGDTRTVSLFYASGQAGARTLVQADVAHDPAQAPPTVVSAQLRTSDGATASAENYYTYQSPGGRQRVAVLADTRALATGVYPHYFRVRGWWG